MIPERDRIQTVMTPAEIAAALESGDYSAEMLMQHLIRHHNRLERELAAEQELADKLAGCMAHLANYDWFIDGTESHSVVCGLPPNQVREALAAWKGARGE